MICADPTQTFPVRLSGDDDRKDAPTFHLRFITAAEVGRVASLVAEADAAERKGDDVAATKLLLDAIAVGLVRADGIPDGKGPADVLSLDELSELAARVQYEPRSEERRRKKASASQPAT